MPSGSKLMRVCSGYVTPLKLTLAVVSGLLVANCSRTTGIVGTECVAWQPISWSSKDTSQTITEVKLNNARRAAWCAGAKP